MYLPDVSETELYDQLSIGTRKDQVMRGKEKLLEAELSDEEEDKNKNTDELRDVAKPVKINKDKPNENLNKSEKESNSTEEPLKRKRTDSI